MNQWSEFDTALNDLLENTEGGRIKIFTEVYALICKEKQPGLALRRFMEKTKSSRKLKGADEEDDSTALDFMQFEYRCGTLVEGILDKLMSDRMDENDFYRAVWDEIQESRYFEQENEKVYAMYEIWSDGRIPYYKMPEGIRMGNEEFAERIKNNLDQIRKIIFVLNSKFAQKTEKSSLLLEILDSLETEEDKAVILAQILAMIDKHAYLKGIHKTK